MCPCAERERGPEMLGSRRIRVHSSAEPLSWGRVSTAHPPSPALGVQPPAAPLSVTGAALHVLLKGRPLCLGRPSRAFTDLDGRQLPEPLRATKAAGARSEDGSEDAGALAPPAEAGLFPAWAPLLRPRCCRHVALGSRRRCGPVGCPASAGEGDPGVQGVSGRAGGTELGVWAASPSE